MYYSLSGTTQNLLFNWGFDSVIDSFPNAYPNKVKQNDKGTAMYSGSNYLPRDCNNLSLAHEQAGCNLEPTWIPSSNIIDF